MSVGRMSQVRILVRVRKEPDLKTIETDLLKKLQVSIELITSNLARIQSHLRSNEVFEPWHHILNGM
jgi:hypothetical protein